MLGSWIDPKPSPAAGEGRVGGGPTDHLVPRLLSTPALTFGLGVLLVMAPWLVKNVVDTGNPNVLVTERGVSFGYNTLVSDMRALPILAETGAPLAGSRIVHDGEQSQGRRRYAAFSVSIAKRQLHPFVVELALDAKPFVPQGSPGQCRRRKPERLGRSAGDHGRSR